MTEVDPKIHKQANNKCEVCNGAGTWITPGFERLHENFPDLHPKHRCWSCDATGLAFHLKLGKFYRDKSGNVWCCFRLDMNRPAHCVADCVLTAGNSQRIEYFFLDGRYDGGGKRELCLVEEVPAGTVSKFDLQVY